MAHNGRLEPSYGQEAGWMQDTLENSPGQNTRIRDLHFADVAPFLLTQKKESGA